MANFDFSPTSAASNVVPVSGIADWVSWRTDLSTADPLPSGDVDLRSVQTIEGGTPTVLIRVNNAGTTLRLRMKYNKAAPTPDSQLTVRVFGAVGSGGDYALLRNLNGDVAVLVLADRLHDSWVEVGSPNWLATTPDNSAHSWDCDGCDRFVVGITSSFNTEGGTDYGTTASIEAKIV